MKNIRLLDSVKIQYGGELYRYLWVERYPDKLYRVTVTPFKTFAKLVEDLREDKQVVYQEAGGGIVKWEYIDTRLCMSKLTKQIFKEAVNVN